MLHTYTGPLCHITCETAEMTLELLNIGRCLHGDPEAPPERAVAVLDGNGSVLAVDDRFTDEQFTGLIHDGAKFQVPLSRMSDLLDTDDSTVSLLDELAALDYAQAHPDQDLTPAYATDYLGDDLSDTPLADALAAEYPDLTDTLSRFTW